MKNKNKLPKRFKDKWVKALRSGKYRQGRSSLYYNKDKSYCCLGVAGNLCGIPNKLLYEKSYYDKLSYENIDIIVEKYKLPKQLVGNENKSLSRKLATFNDRGKSFKWIASYIERYL